MKHKILILLLFYSLAIGLDDETLIYKLKFLDLGVSQISSETNPISPHKSLIYFKEQFGSIAIIRKAYQKIIS